MNALFDDAVGCGVPPLFGTYDAGTIRVESLQLHDAQHVHHSSVAGWLSFSAKGAGESGRRDCAALIHDAPWLSVVVTVTLRCRLIYTAARQNYTHCRSVLRTSYDAIVINSTLLMPI